MQSTTQIYNRKLNQAERVHSKVPISNIALIATILGNVTPENLKEVIKKMQKRHPILNTHLQSKERDLWLIGSEEIDIPVKVIQRVSNDQWMSVILEEHKIPFDMEIGPLIRIILLYSETISNLVIFCQHTICDGLSLAYLARDIMTYLGSPFKDVELLPPAPILDEKNIPSDVKISALAKLIMGSINKKWEKCEVLFNYDDFRELHRVYWLKYDYKTHLYQFSKETTESFIKACRTHDVTVNTALITAFAMAQNKLTPNSPKYLTKYATVANLRKVLLRPIDDQFGFFAGGTEFKFKISKKDSLWSIAKKISKITNPQTLRKQVLQSVAIRFLLSATFIESQLFAAFGDLLPPSSPSYAKMQKFLHDDKNPAVQMIKKRLSKGIVMAQIMTNLGKMDFPEKYGPLILQDLILMPACSPYTELVLGVVTQSGILSITLNHMESTISTAKILQIGEIANKILMDAIKS